MTLYWSNNRVQQMKCCCRICKKAKERKQAGRGESLHDKRISNGFINYALKTGWRNTAGRVVN